MLIIKLGDRETHFETRIWHVGDPFPECRLYPCVSFQADGHELQMILEAMRTAEVKPSMWVNIFSSFRDYKSYSSHDSRLEADSYAKKCALPRFACVEVPEGGGLNG